MIYHEELATDLAQRRPLGRASSEHPQARPVKVGEFPVDRREIILL